MQRIGTDYGGWTVPVSILHRDSICYCAGCGEDISFDLRLIDMFQCHVFAFDPTPRSIEYVKNVAGNNSCYHFYPYGLWDTNTEMKFYEPAKQDYVSHSILNLQKTERYFEAPCKRLSHILKELGHTYLDLLKIDIEGAEYRVLDSIKQDKIDVGILCIEFDEWFNPLDKQCKKRILKSITMLKKCGYSMIHSKGNGNYTFINKKHFT
jgi:FkbM family methyltransferase